MEVKRILIAGGRDYTDYYRFEAWMNQNLSSFVGEYKLVIVHGNAHGADKMGEQYALKHGYEIDSHPAEWDKYNVPGRKNPAGMIRNREMLKVSDCLCAVWDGVSRGTYDMISLVLDAGKPIRILRY